MEDYTISFLSKPERTDDTIAEYFSSGEQFESITLLIQILAAELTKRTTNDFNNFVESKLEQSTALLITFTILISIIGIIALLTTFKHILNMDYKLKKMYLLVPQYIIIKNRWIRAYITRTSGPYKNQMRKLV